MESKRILPITCNKDTQLSFHLSAVLSDDMKAWFYNRFINIRCWGIDLVVVDFMDNVIDDSYRDLFDERICYDPQRVPNGRRLIKSLKRNLCKDFYSYLWVDKYEITIHGKYLDNSISYRARKFNNELWNHGKYFAQFCEPFERLLKGHSNDDTEAAA